MESIKAKCSAVESFSGECSAEYIVMLNTANDILKQIEKIHYEAQREQQKIRMQIIKLKSTQENLTSKATRYSSLINETQSDCQKYSREMDYIRSHPIATTKTDSEGNEYTEMVVDEVAYRAAARRQAEASSFLNLQMSRQASVYETNNKVKSKLESFEWTYKGATLVVKNIEKCIYEIKKTISAMEYEAKYNNMKLGEVKEALSAYLASKPIFLPSGATYNVFAESDISK